MMAQVDHSAERSAQTRVARKYKVLGYDVFENPGPDRLPSFMRDVAPDLVARSSSDNVVIEVKRRGSLKGSNELIGIAERVSGHPDWRFELVVVDDAEDAGPPSDEEYARLLDTVHAATSHQLFDVAFVYLVSVLVRTARVLAKRNRISPDKKADRDLFLDLGFKGILPDDLLERCLAALSTGNDLVDAPGGTSVSVHDVQSVIRSCEALRHLL